MRKWHLVVAAFFIIINGASGGGPQEPSGKAVVRLNSALDSLISPDAQLELVKSGFGITEGPTWVQKGKTGYLLFSDIPANVIYKMTPDGNVTVFLDKSGYAGPFDGYTFLTVGSEGNNGKDPSDPSFRRFILLGSNGLTLDPQGRLIICMYSGRAVVRLERNGTHTMLADHYEGKRLGGPNDVVAKNDGAIYFSDTFAGMRLREKDPAKELDYEGIYKIQDGRITLVVEDIPRTNGLAFSPDEKYLYANGGMCHPHTTTPCNFIRRYEVHSDDTLTDSRMLIDLSADKTPGGTDGMKLDSKGNIYSTGPGGVWVITPEGQHIGTIRTPEIAVNLTFGDPDYKTLYIMAHTGIYKIRVITPGHHR